MESNSTLELLLVPLEANPCTYLASFWLFSWEQRYLTEVTREIVGSK